MIESLMAILFVCLLFFSVFQLAHAFASREVLRHAAARAARARTVGFNTWMVTKVMRAAAIPDAGRLLTADAPSDLSGLGQALSTRTPGEVWDLALAASPRSTRARFEVARIPDYLAAENQPRATQYLDYEDWDSIRGTGLGGSGFGPAPSTATLDVDVRQDYPLTLEIRAFLELAGALTPALEDGNLLLRGSYDIERHYPLYLDDQGL